MMGALSRTLAPTRPGAGAQVATARISFGEERRSSGTGEEGTQAEITIPRWETAMLHGCVAALRDGARRQYDAGRAAIEAIMQIDLGFCGGWAEPERIAPNVLRLYEDFAGAEWQPFDLTAMGAAQTAWLTARE